MNKILYSLFVISFYIIQSTAFAQTKIEFPSEDNVTVTADLYESAKEIGGIDKKIAIVLFHQAGSSRGEYRQIAPRLAKLGYVALAVDQRSGGEFGNVKNETAARAKSGRDFPSALPDMRSAINYARKELGAQKVVAWGSSYSASLSLVLAGRQPVVIDGVLAFSPGEYFGKTINVEDEATSIKVPAFVTSARNELSSWNAIFKAIPSTDKTAFKPQGNGKHGSSTLLSKDSDEYWQAIETFLSRHF